MKALKICIIACSLGIFATSCRNKDCDANTASENAAPATATSINDGTEAAMPVAADTPAQDETGIASGERESSSRSGRQARSRSAASDNTPASASGSGNGSTPAEVDLKAAKKREANFTHGTGSENAGR